MTPVDQLIGLFDGIRPMAEKLGESKHTIVQQWKITGKIPTYRKGQILLAAMAHGIKIPPGLIAALFPDQPSADEIAPGLTIRQFKRRAA